MKKLLLLPLVAWLFASCATIFNKPTHITTVTWRSPATIVIDSDTLTFEGTKQTRV